MFNPVLNQIYSAIKQTNVSHDVSKSMMTLLVSTTFTSMQYEGGPQEWLRLSTLNSNRYFNTDRLPVLLKRTSP